MIKLKRVYEKPGPGDGCRILVDRLWPRGVSKAAAKLDLWLKEVAPSDSLRQWFAHDPAKWEEFQKRYAAELEGKAGLLRTIRDLERKEGTVTLLFGAKDPERNQAVALKRLLS